MIQTAIWPSSADHAASHRLRSLNVKDTILCRSQKLSLSFRFPTASEMSAWLPMAGKRILLRLQRAATGRLLCVPNVLLGHTCEICRGDVQAYTRFLVSQIVHYAIAAGIQSRRCLPVSIWRWWQDNGVFRVPMLQFCGDRRSNLHRNARY